MTSTRLSASEQIHPPAFIFASRFCSRPSGRLRELAVGSKARESFLDGLDALRQSIDTPLVTGADTVGSFLRRGLTVVSYNLLEAFMTERLEETAAYINGGLSHFADLPDRIKKAATQELL